MNGKALARTGGQGNALEIPAAGGALQQVDVDSEARLLEARWGSSTSLKPDDFRTITIIARESGMNPIWDLDILNNQPFDKAEFWKGLLAAHPDVESVEQKRIRPGTDEWEEWIGEDDPDVIAAAVLTRVVMRNRALPIEEVNYVLKSDPILWERSSEKTHHGEGDAAKRAAEEATAGAEGAKMWYDNGQRDWSKKKGWWSQGASTLAPGWRPNALKKARTTSIRRAAKLAVPREHARVLRGMERMERLITAREESGPRAAVATQADPYSLPTHGEAEVHRQLPAPSAISEDHRRMLFAQAGQKGLDGVDLKALIARVLGIPRDEVSTSKLTYEQLPAIVDAIQAIPDTGVDELEEGEQEEYSAEEEAPATARPRADGPPDWGDVPPPAEDPRLDLGGGW